jgi:hypothetical protein
MPAMDRFYQIIDFLERLEEAHIHYTLAKYRDRMISVLITVPGERWEVDFGEDSVDIEVFRSEGKVEDWKEGAKLEELFERFSD